MRDVCLGNEDLIFFQLQLGLRDKRATQRESVTERHSMYVTECGLQMKQWIVSGREKCLVIDFFIFW